MKNIKISHFFNLKFIHFSVITSIHLLQVSHAAHLQKLLPQSQLTQVKHNYDKEVYQRFSAWDKLLLDGQNQTDENKLKLVNKFFNKMKWVSDKDLWNTKDYWATPIESLLRNAGDCEDFSIAKYFTLLELGIPIEKLKISYVKIIDYNQSHMVLAYYPTPDSEALILDNMNKNILKSSQRTDLKQEFNFNDDGVWAHNEPNHRLDSVTKIDHWSSLIQRMKELKN